MEFQKTDRPRVAPMACLACGGQKGPVADLGIEKPLFGRVYLCEQCVRQLVKAFGWPLRERFDGLAAETAGLRSRVEALEAELAEAEANRVVPLADVAEALRKSMRMKAEKVLSDQTKAAS